MTDNHCDRQVLFGSSSWTHIEPFASHRRQRWRLCSRRSASSAALP